MVHGWALAHPRPTLTSSAMSSRLQQGLKYRDVFTGSQRINFRMQFVEVAHPLSRNCSVLWQAHPRIHLFRFALSVHLDLNEELLCAIAHSSFLLAYPAVLLWKNYKRSNLLVSMLAVIMYLRWLFQSCEYMCFIMSVQGSTNSLVLKLMHKCKDASEWSFTKEQSTN